MPDIELVIKISKIEYEHLTNKEKFYSLIKSKQEWLINKILYHIVDSTPLTEGHGRIGDLDKLIKAMKERNDDNGGEPLNAVDRGYDLAFQHMIEESKECVIIEVEGDKE